jgi:hypothetical protein
MESSKDLLAAIRGICLGVGDPQGKNCLGDFPIIVQSRCPSGGEGSWYDSLSQLCADKTLSEACTLLNHLLEEWGDIDLTLSAEHAVSRHSATSTFQLIDAVLRNPLHFLPSASFLGEILAFEWGIRVSRHPPYGHIAGSGELNAYVLEHFQKPGIYRMEAVLLSKLKGYSLQDACNIIADLISRWRASRR